MYRLKQVLETLTKNTLMLEIQKCEFARTSSVYLGNVVLGGKLRVELTKVEASLKWPIPSTTTKTRSFIGVVQYLRL
jgi:hypothetical protein